VSDEAAFLSAIAEKPEDDTVRLVYADWLQERNDPRADYLRLEVRRHRLTKRQREKEDPSRNLEKLRKHATPDWLSRIDRTTRFSVYWPPEVCQEARDREMIGTPLAKIRERPTQLLQFPKEAQVGDYFYVLAGRDGQLLLVGRLRVKTLLKVRLADWSRVTGVTGTEGTPIRLDRAVPPAVTKRISWYSGNKEQTLSLSLTGAPRLVPLARILRLTPRTASDMDAILRGETIS
jgi:uncharacterized protein (TIGR02996 family)